MDTLATHPPTISTDTRTPSLSHASGFSRWLPPLGVAAAGVLVSCLLFYGMRNADRERIQTTAEFRAEWRARDIERRIDAQTKSLEPLAVYVAAENEIDGAKFHRFAQQMRESGDPARAVFWIPRVDGDQRAAFEAKLRSAGLPNYRITDPVVPASEPGAHFPVLYQELFEGGGDLRGADLLAVPEWRQAAFRARDGGRPAGLGPVRLLAVPSTGPGYMIFWPVYAGGEVPPSADARREQLRGFIVESFRIEALLASTIRGTPAIVEAIRFLMKPEGSPGDPIPVAAYRPETGAIQFDDSPLAPPPPGGIRVKRSFDIAGQDWVLVSDFPQGAVSALQFVNAWAWLFTGLFLTALLVVYVLRERRRLLDVEIVVGNRTAELTKVNESLSREVEERRRVEETLKRSTETLAATLEAAPFAIISLDPDQRVLVWNHAAERIFGFTAGEVIGRRYPLAPREKTGEFNDLFRRTAAGEMLRDVHVRRLQKSGRLLDISLSTAPIYEDGKLRTVVCALADVTQASVVEAQLRQAQKMEAVGQLTGGLAHDFNNLLGIIIGNLDLLHETHKADPAVEELSRDALDAALRGRDLTQRLLAFARRQPLRPECLDANALVRDITKLLSRTLGENIEIKLDLAGNLWPVMADPAQLETAITNLANNGRDAMPKGGRLVISTHNERLDQDYADHHADVRPGDYAVIEVSDTGVGMSSETAARIFEPFFTTKGLGKGTGLGLSMVFGFMKQSGGHINVYSEIGKGSTFRLYLPRVQAGVAPADSDVKVMRPSAVRGETILVVEDNAKLRRVVVKQLNDLGYRVLDADNATNALAIINGAEKLDLLFTDIVMPGDMDGCALFREAKIRRPDLRVLFTSGYPEARLTEGDAPPAGTRLLSKPYRKEDLTRVLREILDDQGSGSPVSASLERSPEPWR